MSNCGLSGRQFLSLLSIVVIVTGWIVTDTLQNQWDRHHEAWFVAAQSLDTIFDTQIPGLFATKHTSWLSWFDQAGSLILLLCAFIFGILLVRHFILTKPPNFSQKDHLSYPPVNLSKIAFLPSWLASHSFNWYQVMLLSLLVILLVVIQWILIWLQLILDRQQFLQTTPALQRGCIKEVTWLDSQYSNYLRFELLLPDAEPSNARARINLYPPKTAFALQPTSSAAEKSLVDGRALNHLLSGRCFKWRIKFKQPRNFANGLQFNYETLLLSQAILATGHAIDVWDEQGGLVSATLFQQLPMTEPDVLPWHMGLLRGDQSAFSSHQWQIAKATGTLHLLVVSGLHISVALFIVVGLVHFLLRVLASLFGTTPLLNTVPLRWLHWLLITASMLALLLVIDSGISVYRSLAMACLALLVLAMGRHVNWTLTVIVMMAAITLCWPLVMLKAGFWYSFISVIALLVFFENRRSHWLDGIVFPPWVLFIALMPLVIFFGGVVGWHQILANLVAVPLLTFIILPLTLLQAMLQVIGQLIVMPDFLTDQVTAALFSVDTIFWQWLDWCDQLPLARWTYWSTLHSILWLVLLALAGLGVNRWLVGGLFFISCLLMSWREENPNPHLTVLDVGQGQSVVIASDQHQMLIDTGQRFSERFSVAQNIIRPFLLSSDARVIDYLVISHSDSDHAGDVPSLWSDVMTVERVYAGQPLPDELPTFIRNCHLHDNWYQVDQDFKFRFLVGPQHQRVSDNNHSCIVQAEWFGYRILIPSDIDHKMERALVAHYGGELASDMLVLGHHGSRSSSSVLWLKAVKPRFVVISYGLNNRYRHPHPDVIQRLNSFYPDAQVFHTALHGAITLMPDGRTISRREYQ